MAFARAGAKLYMAEHSQGGVEESNGEIKRKLGGRSDLLFLELNIEATSRNFLELNSCYDVLVANSGIRFRNEWSVNGKENSIAVNVFCVFIRPPVSDPVTVENTSDTKLLPYVFSPLR